MKKHLLILGLLFCSKLSVSQTRETDKAFIREFLLYTKSGKMNIDTVTEKFIIMDPREASHVTRQQRKEMIFQLAEAVGKQLDSIEIDDVKIVPFNNAEQDLTEEPKFDWNTAINTYVAATNDRSFVRYFLMEKNKIKALLLHQGRVFLIFE